MATNKNECIEYALHAYDIFWDYYKKTLDERNQILNNYLLFVGIPISITGIITEKIIDTINKYSCWLILALTIILVLGIVIYDAYIVESFISERYLHQIKEITNYLIQNYDSTYNNIFQITYSLDNLFLDGEASQKHRIRKSFIIAIINTGIIISIFCLICFNFIRWYLIALSIIVSLFLHTIIFFGNMRNFQITNN